MVEMKTLTAAIYRLYRTKVKPGTEDTSPGITSRFEVFCDESMPLMKVCLPDSYFEYYVALRAGY